MQTLKAPNGVLNNFGFGLMEVLAGLVVGLFVVIGAFQVLNRVSEGEMKFRFFRQVQELKLETIGYLSSRVNCTASFSGVNPVTNTPERTQLLIDGSPNFRVFSGTGPVYSDNSIRILRYYFKTGAASDFVVVDPVERKAMASLFVDFQSHNPRLSGVEALSRSIKLSLVLQPSGQIDNCVAAGNDEDSLWKLSGTNIFFAPAPGPARAGIGTNGPIAELDFHGYMRTQGTLESAMAISAPIIAAGTISSPTFRSRQFLNSSDQNLKSEVVTIENWKPVLRLNAVSYHQVKGDQKAHFGFLAQEMRRIYPYVVHGDPDHEFLKVEYFPVLAPVLEGLKETRAQSDQLRRKIELIEKRKLTQ